MSQWINDNPLLFGGILVALLVVWLPFFKSDREKKKDIVRDFADNHGLHAVFPDYEYDASPFERTTTCQISGTYDGVQINIAMGNDTQYISIVTPRTAKWYLEFRATLQGWPRDVKISREGLASRVSKLVGQTDVEVGHAEFDRKFLVKGPEETAKRALSGSTIATLLRLESMDYDFVIEDGELVLSVDPRPFDRPKLRRTTRSMTQAAKRISDDLNGV